MYNECSSNCKVLWIPGRIFYIFILKAHLAYPYIDSSRINFIAFKGAFLVGLLIYAISGVILRLVIFPIDDEDIDKSVESQKSTKHDN